MFSLKILVLNRFVLGSFHGQHLTNFCEAVLMLGRCDDAHDLSTAQAEARKLSKRGPV